MGEERAEEKRRSGKGKGGERRGTGPAKDGLDEGGRRVS